MDKMNSGLFGVVLDTVNAAASFNGRDDKGPPGALRVSHSESVPARCFCMGTLGSQNDSDPGRRGDHDPGAVARQPRAVRRPARQLSLTVRGGVSLFVIVHSCQ
jgi:hypothetical protein